MKLFSFSFQDAEYKNFHYSGSDAIKTLADRFFKIERERNEYKYLAQFLVQRRLGGKVEIPIQEVCAIDPRMELSIVLKDGLVVIELVPRNLNHEP